MFRSKTRSLVIPQSEHARLSGLLAHLWGNNAVPAPPVDRAAFTTGVTHHDRGYGLLDAMGIGEADEAVWLATQRRGIETPLSDPTADTVALMHIRRLLTLSDHPDVQQVIERAEARIAATIARTGYTRDVFEQADTITRTCDMISFRFCFEAPVEFVETVSTDGGPLDIHICIAEAGQILLDPWPLVVPEVHGFIMGYAATGYPDHPQPVTVPFIITPQR